MLSRRDRLDNARARHLPARAVVRCRSRHLPCRHYSYHRCARRPKAIAPPPGRLSPAANALLSVIHLVECVTGLRTELAEDCRRGAKAGERRLKHVGPGERREEKPPRTSTLPREDKPREHHQPRTSPGSLDFVSDVLAKNWLFPPPPSYSSLDGLTPIEFAARPYWLATRSSPTSIAFRAD